jgi:hypothetical protein
MSRQNPHPDVPERSTLALLTSHISAAERIKLKPEVFRVSFEEISKNIFPFRLFIKLIRIADSVSGFMSEQNHQIFFIIGCVSHFLFKPYQPVVGQMEGNPDNGYAIRTPPFITGAGKVISRLVDKPFGA